MERFMQAEILVRTLEALRAEEDEDRKADLRRALRTSVEAYMRGPDSDARAQPGSFGTADGPRRSAATLHDT